MEKGYIHVYTGNGKGKTTAALGLSLRAVCSGKKVFFGQFVKGMKYSELKCTKYLDNLEIMQFGRGCFIYKDPTEEDIAAARKAWRSSGCIKIREYEVVVMMSLILLCISNFYSGRSDWLLMKERKM